MNTEENSILEILRAHINRKFTFSPSPFTLWLDPIIRKVEVGSLTFEYEVRKNMTNPIKTLHGGAIAGIMDDIIGATVYSLGLKDLFTTVNLTVDYFAPSTEGNILLANTEIIKKGRQIIHVVCELRLKNNQKLLARGTSNLIKVERKINLK